MTCFSCGRPRKRLAFSLGDLASGADMAPFGGTIGPCWSHSGSGPAALVDLPFQQLGGSVICLHVGMYHAQAAWHLASTDVLATV